jgi:hypothetical protein
MDKYESFNTWVEYLSPILDSWGSQDILPGFGPGDPRSNRGESVQFSQGLPGSLFQKVPPGLDTSTRAEGTV